MQEQFLPNGSLEFRVGWKRDQRDKGEGYVLDKSICCGPFRIEFRFLQKGGQWIFSRPSKNESIIILAGNIQAPDGEMSWDRMSYPFPNGLFSAQEDSLVVFVEDVTHPSRTFKHIWELNHPLLQLQPQDSGNEDCFPLQWRRFEKVVGLWRTWPDVVIGKWHIKLWLASPQLNCGIHKHSQEPWLKETHFLLDGSGDMVIYKEDDIKTENQRIQVERFKTHRPLWKERGGKVVYPYHAWQAGPEGSLFAVIEEWTL